MTDALTRRTLIIDTDVLQGASESGPPHAQKLWEFLRLVLDICHRAGVTDALEVEWHAHASKYAVKWQASMATVRKRRLLGRGFGGLKKRALAVAGDDAVRAIIEKDWHLVEGALEADKVIVSCDTQARHHFARAAATVADLRNLTWVDLGQCDADAVEKWLRADAAPWPEWMLG
jgi:hypothetical protein